jgi:hypothetical protein
MLKLEHNLQIINIKNMSERFAVDSKGYTEDVEKLHEYEDILQTKPKSNELREKLFKISHKEEFNDEYKINAKIKEKAMKFLVTLDVEDLKFLATKRPDDINITQELENRKSK